MTDSADPLTSSLSLRPHVRLSGRHASPGPRLTYVPLIWKGWRAQVVLFVNVLVRGKRSQKELAFMCLMRTLAHRGRVLCCLLHNPNIKGSEALLLFFFFSLQVWLNKENRANLTSSPTANLLSLKTMPLLPSSWSH